LGSLSLKRDLKGNHHFYLIIAAIAETFNLIVCPVLTALTGCYFDGPCIEGSGPLISEIRDVEGFSAVTNTGSFEVQVTLTDSFAVEVRAQENILHIIKTYVSGDSLIT
jgi:hypothetical protein